MDDGDQLWWGPTFWPQWGPIDPEIWPYHRRVEILVKSVDPGFVNNGSLGDGDQLWWEPIFLSQWGPIGPKMGPRGSPRDLAPSP